MQTQFNYVDIGVNIDMTPTVHLDRGISLKMKVEDSTHAGDSVISGVTEPIIGQRSIEHTIQLREGEPSILAGILTKQDNATSSGTPGLSQLPDSEVPVRVAVQRGAAGRGGVCTDSRTWCASRC